jgi:hypothetical protein
MKIQYKGDAPTMNYIIGRVEPEQKFELKKELADKLLATGLFIEVKVKKAKKDGD